MSTSTPSTRRVPNSVLTVLVLIGFGAYVLAPALIPTVAGAFGLADQTVISLLNITAFTLEVAFWLVIARLVLSPVHEARNDQAPLKVLTSSLTSAPWSRPRLVTFAERTRSMTRRLSGKPDTFNEVRARLNNVYETDPELALQLYREWAAARGVPSVPVVTKPGVFGRIVKSAWSSAFAWSGLHWLHSFALLAKRITTRVTDPIVIPPQVLGTRLAFVARPWGGSRMQRLSYRAVVPRGAFVIDIAPILVLVAITALATGVAISLANFG
jgi:hypothetical protein